MNPLDYSVWDILQELVYEGRSESYANFRGVYPPEAMVRPPKMAECPPPQFLIIMHLGIVNKLT